MFSKNTRKKDEPDKNRQKEPPTLVETLLPILALIIFIGGDYLVLRLPVEPMVLPSAVVASFVALRFGYSWEEMMVMVSQKMARAWPALLVLLMIGFLIRAQIAGGSIPLMIYWGLKIINPQYLAFIALIVTVIVSTCTGTSWGSAGTIGVAFMGIAIGMNASPPMVAGAVVARAYFGGKVSPLSDTISLASIIAGVNTFTHIKNMLWASDPAFVLAMVIYLAIDLVIPTGAEVSEKVGTMLQQLEAVFNLNLIVMIPIIVVIAGAAMHFPTTSVMFLSSVLTMGNALFFQGQSIQNVVQSIINGFKLGMISRPAWSKIEPVEDTSRPLERGGTNSMLDTLLICFCAILLAGIMALSGSFEFITERILENIESKFGLIVSTVYVCLGTTGATSNRQISIIMPGEVFRPSYIRRGIAPKVFSRTVEDSVSVTECLTPWTTAGAYMAVTLGISTLAYLPWTMFNWSGMVTALILAATGLGITYLTKSEQLKLLSAEGLNKSDIVTEGK